MRTQLCPPVKTSQNKSHNLICIWLCLSYPTLTLFDSSCACRLKCPPASTLPDRRAPLTNQTQPLRDNTAPPTRKAKAAQTFQQQPAPTPFNSFPNAKDRSPICRQQIPTSPFLHSICITDHSTALAKFHAASTFNKIIATTA